MISIFKNFDKAPKDLHGDDPKITEAVKRELYELYHGKCAFTEEKLPFEEMVVIDFLPLDMFEEVLNPAHMRWGNLLPVSKDVAKRWGKLEPFYAPFILKEITRIDDYTQLLKVLQPQIVHPEVDTPENHFYFYDLSGSIQGNTDRGNYTIRMVGLFQAPYTKKRKKILDDIVNAFETKLKNLYTLDLENIDEKTLDKLGFKDLFNKINALKQPEQEFSIVGYFLWHFQMEVLGNHFSKFFKSLNFVYQHYTLPPNVLKINNQLVPTSSKYEDKVLPYSLSYFEIQKYYSIRHLYVDSLQVNAQWIFLTGENGFGKTLILQAITAGLMGQKDWNPELKKDDKIVDDNTIIRFSIFNSDTNFETRWNNNRRHLIKNQFPYFAAYGPNRTQLKPTEGVMSIPKKTDSIFGKSYIMRHNVEEQLTKLHGRNGNFEKQFNLIIAVLKELLPQLEITIDDTRVDKKVLYLEINEAGEKLAPIEFSALSAGTRSIVALVGDMLIELMQHQPDAKDSTELAGIVIIDEIDIHLHPKWQRELVINLSKLFPKVQFIASTHSPIPLLGAPRETVILNVEKENMEKGITIQRLDTKIDITKLTPNTILSSPIFGFGNILPEYRDKEQPIYTDDTYDEVLFEKMLQKKLQELMGGDLDELKKLLTPEK